MLGKNSSQKILCDSTVKSNDRDKVAPGEGEVRGTNIEFCRRVNNIAGTPKTRETAHVRSFESHGNMNVFHSAIPSRDNSEE